MASRLRLRSSLLVVVLLLASVAFAATSATIRGRVTYTNGDVISKVMVEATNVETNLVYSGETNDQGLYTIPYLPPGTYRVIVRRFALRTIVKPEIELHVQDEVALNFSMELGSSVESVTLEAGAPRIQSDASRGGNFSAEELQRLPLIDLNPISLARTLPGMAAPAGSTLFGILNGDATEFSVNGTRVRGNNYLLDGTNNNDIAFTGVAQPFNIADAVQEVSIQTGNFSAEFGRSSGGIFSVVTRSGTNDIHGTFSGRYQAERFNSVSNVDKLNQRPQLPFSNSVYGATLGGPIHRDKTFFFAGFQKDTLRSPQDSVGTAQNASVVVPTEAAVQTLRSLFPSNPRLDFYLKFLGSLRGTANPINLKLGLDPATGVDRGFVQFASAYVDVPVRNGGSQWLVRVDHRLGTFHTVALRYIKDTHTNSPNQVHFPGFVLEKGSENSNVLLTDQYAFSPHWSNEFRFSYARQSADTQRITRESVPEAQTLPGLNIQSIDSPAANANLIQRRQVDNYLLQETQTRQSGSHTFRYGVELLIQRATQRPSARSNGEIAYNDAFGYSAFANFLDDFSGPSAIVRKDFGATTFHPNQFHHSYFFQDKWLPFPSLSLTAGIRYENFGQPANVMKYPAFAGFNPEDFLKPNRVNPDNNNFGPAFGFAWSPGSRSGWLGKLLGGNETVVRGGFQVSYEPFFTQMISLLLSASSPNAISVTKAAQGSGRGAPNWSQQVPEAPIAPSLLDSQLGVLDKNLRNPYTELWSLGFQRAVSRKVVLDGSYVGSAGHKLTTWDKVNPLDRSGQRLHPEFGPRDIRTSAGSSSYHAMQWRIIGRIASGLQATVSYTWSKYLDSTSEGVAAVNNQSLGGNRLSVPIASGGLKLDYGPSDFDRPHRLTILYLWNIRGPREGLLRTLLSGWSLTGITTFQSGAAFSVQNGSNRNNNGGGNDRPEIGNPNAPLNTRAILAPVSTCSTGYLNPDTSLCVTPADVHWVEGTGPPTPSTVGRNTLRAGGVNNFDLSLSKSFPVSERQRLEVRWEVFNALNHPQYIQIPERTVFGSAGPQNGLPSRFLNREFTDSGIRTMWAQLKFTF